MSQLQRLLEGLTRLGAMSQRGTEPAVSLEDVQREHDLDSETLKRLANSQGWEATTEYPALEKLGVGVDAAFREQGMVQILGRLALGGTIFLAAIVFVAGGILEGYSALFGERRLLAFACLAALLVALALFEGLQICVTLLRFKEFEFFADFKRAAELHRLFKSEAGTRRFLAGRQFFVVFLVFFIARTTTFPQLRHIPLLGTPLPAYFEPLWYGLFDLGLMGAFLVLWVAQLAPQFGANRDPLAFLSLPGMGLALRSSFLIDDLGLTLPGLWFSSWVRERKEMLGSRAERFRLASEEEVGAVALLVRRHLLIEGSTVVINSEKRLKLTKGGSDTFEDESLAINARRISHTTSASRVVRHGAEVEVFNQVETRRIGPTAVLSYRVTPKHGVFENGDVVALGATVRCEGSGEHLIEIEEPTRLVHLLFEVDVALMARLGEVTVQRADPHWPEKVQETTLAFSTDETADGTVAVAEYFCVFPRLGEVLRCSWSSQGSPRSAHRRRIRSNRCLSSRPARGLACGIDGEPRH